MIHRIPKITFEENQGRPPRTGDWMHVAVSCVDYIDEMNAVHETRVCLALSEAALVASEHDINGGGTVETYWFDIFYGGIWRLRNSSPASEILQTLVSEGV